MINAQSVIRRALVILGFTIVLLLVVGISTTPPSAQGAVDPDSAGPVAGEDWDPLPGTLLQIRSNPAPRVVVTVTKISPDLQVA